MYAAFNQYNNLLVQGWTFGDNMETFTARYSGKFDYAHGKVLIQTTDTNYVANEGTKFVKGDRFLIENQANFQLTYENGQTIDRSLIENLKAKRDPLKEEQQSITESRSPINDSASANEDTNATGNVLDNDTGTATVATFTVDGQTANAGSTLGLISGELTIEADGSFVFTPVSDWNGQVPNITYTTTDNHSASLEIFITAVNDEPTALADLVKVQEDQVFESTQSLIANDVDIDGDKLSAVAETVITEQGGTLVIAVDGSYSYYPPVGFFGFDSAQYTLTDGSLDDKGTLTIWVQENKIIDGKVTVSEDYQATGNLLASDSTTTVTIFTVDGQTANAGSTLGLISGELTIEADGSFVFTPVSDWNGQVPNITYTTTDNHSASLDIFITAVNDEPTALADLVTVQEGQVFESTQSLIANDVDIDGDKLSAVAETVTTEQGGTLVIAADGSYSYYPPVDFFGFDSAQYTLTDGSLDDKGTLTIWVQQSLISDDSFTANEDTIATGNVLENDGGNATVATFTVDGQTANAGSTVGCTGGHITIAANGDFTFTPFSNWNGQVPTVTYTNTDGHAATLDIVIDAINDAPVANGSFVMAHENQVLASTQSIFANDIDVEGDRLSAVAETVTTANGGTLEIRTDGSYNYTPAAGFSGFDTAVYQVSDGELASPGTLSIWVQESPISDDSFTANEDTIATGNVLENDGGNATVATFTVDGQTANAGSTVGCTGGHITIAANGDFTFTPFSNWNGQVPTVTYTNTEGHTATLDIVIDAINDAPVANGSFVMAHENQVLASTQSIFANDIDVEGDRLSAVAETLTNESGSTLQIFANGSYIYTPAAGFYGYESFDYQVSDGTEASTGTLSIWVQENTVVDGSITVSEDYQATGNVLTNNGHEATITGFEVWGQTAEAGQTVGFPSGHLTMAANGDFTFTPFNNWNGEVPIVTYTTSDGHSATLSITVDAVNDAPVANGSFVLAQENQTLNSTQSIFTNDIDIEGQALEAVAETVITENGGTLEINDDGTYSYTPAIGYSGFDSAEYQVTDGELTSSGTLSIWVQAAPSVSENVENDEHNSAQEVSSLAGLLVNVAPSYDINEAMSDSNTDNHSLNNSIISTSLSHNILLSTEDQHEAPITDGNNDSERSFTGNDESNLFISSKDDLSNYQAIEVKPLDENPLNEHIIA